MLITLYNITLNDITLYNITLFNITLHNIALYNITLYDINLYNITVSNILALLYFCVGAVVYCTSQYYILQPPRVTTLQSQKLYHILYTIGYDAIFYTHLDIVLYFIPLDMISWILEWFL